MRSRRNISERHLVRPNESGKDLIVRRTHGTLLTVTHEGQESSVVKAEVQKYLKFSASMAISCANYTERALRHAVRGGNFSRCIERDYLI
jgi:hypothetical protein